MKKIFIVTEGPSEEHFAKAILAPHFLDYDKNIIPITILTKRDNRHGIMYKGGMSSYSKMQNTLEPLRQAISAQPNPELINNSFETAPSKRILKAIPAYDKTVAGIEVLRRIGLNKIRDKCRHFNDWITHLEQI